MHIDIAATAILRRCLHDPSAVRRYDLLRGGFLWSDELPECAAGELESVIAMLAPVIAYRASLTLRQPDSRYEADWDALQAAVPSWPGFRPERIFGSPERDLRGAKLREARCIADVEKPSISDGN